MANRLEAVCLDESKSNLAETLKGIPVITVLDENGKFLTNSAIEAHRMNSPYMLEGDDTTLLDKLKADLNIESKDGPIDIPKFAKFVVKYDTNTALHGVFLSKSDLAGGRYKLTRALSSFIEATGIQPAVSGGVKLDRLNPSGGEGKAKKGYGHIPYSRTEYTAESIKVYFNIDLALIRSYGLGDCANDLLFTLALWKILSLLNTGLRLRTACDLKSQSPLTATYPEDFDIPSLANLDIELREIIQKCRDDGSLTKEPLVLRYKTDQGKKK